MKRALPIVLMALAFGGQGHAQSRYAGPQWTCSLDAIGDGLTFCIQAPEFGMSRYVTDVVAQSTGVAAGLFTLHSGTGVACSVDTAPILVPASTVQRLAAAAPTAAPTNLHFSPPLVVPRGKHMCAEGDPDNSVTIQVVGFTAP